LAGVRKNADFVFERDDRRRAAEGFGETFMPKVREHAITDGFVEAEGAVVIVLTVASSLRSTGGAVEPTPLLETSERAFGMADFFAWAKDPREPEPEQGDSRGPLVVAYAAELPKDRPDAPHGPRMVVIGSSSALYGANWQNEQLRGTAIFVESAISWLAAQPIAVDIPDKPARAVGFSITEEVLRWGLIKLVVLVPLATLLLGLAIQLRRRSSEGRSRRKARAGDQTGATADHEDGDEDEAAEDEKPA
jgi:hypothetical protein